MDKNTITGFSLIALVLVGFYFFNSPSEEEIAKQKQQTEQLAKQPTEEEQKAIVAQKKQKAAEAEAQKALEDSTYVLASALNGTAQNIVLKNEKVQLTINTKGGVVSKAVLNNFKDFKGQQLTIFDEHEQSLSYVIDGKDHNIRTADMYFTPSAQTDSTVTLTAGPEGHQLMITYKLGKEYLLSASIKAVGLEGIIPSKTNSINVLWKENCRQQEKGHSFENRYASLTYHFTEGGTDYLSETGLDEETIDESIDWVGYKSQFFSAVMIAKNNFNANAVLKSEPSKVNGYLKEYTSNMVTAFDPTGKEATEFEFYFGPNDFRLLQSINDKSAFGKDLQMERLVYLGWPLFRYINRWFTLYLFDWLTKLGIPMGIVLILLTLILKVITYPMVKKSYMSSAKMRVLRPKLEEATKKYDKPEDAMQKQQVMMQMYSQYGVSPMSGCLPMLIQMPIWIAMFNFVPNAIQLRGESFLWIDDLSTYDVLFQWNDNLWLIGDHLSLTCILFCVSNVLYSWFTMRQQRDQMVGQQAEQMKMMQYMMFLMPVMFFFMFNDYSAGLNFYYFISLFCSAAIMFFLRKTTDDERLLASLEKKRKENEANPKKMSGLAAQLEKMQRQQQEMERKRQELRNQRMGK